MSETLNCPNSTLWYLESRRGHLPTYCTRIHIHVHMYTCMECVHIRRDRSPSPSSTGADDVSLPKRLLLICISSLVPNNSFKMSIFFAPPHTSSYKLIHVQVFQYFFLIKRKNGMRVRVRTHSHVTVRTSRRHEDLGGRMAELPCYTLINNPSETEIPNEQQLRSDLGK